MSAKNSAKSEERRAWYRKTLSSPYAGHNGPPRRKKEPGPEKRKECDRLPPLEVGTYEFKCSKCGEISSAMRTARGLEVRTTCSHCLRGQSAMMLRIHQDRKRGARLSWLVKCLRCSWSEIATSKYRAKGWACGADPRHPVVVEER